MSSSVKDIECCTQWQYILHIQQQTFNQIDAEGLKALAVLNGFKQEKGKKYQYGDYAEFAFKLN